jgi:uncharacterized membrane protein
MNSLARFCFLSAAVLAAWLGHLSLTRQAVPGCGMGSGCDSVLSSPWAWAGPVPVAWLGALVYVLAFAALCLPARFAWVRPTTLLLFGGCAAAALFFVAVQALVIRQWCPWCCGLHALALTGAAFGLAGRRPSPGDGPAAIRPRAAFAGPRPVRLVATGALATVAVLTAGLSLLPGQPVAESFLVVGADEDAAPLARLESGSGAEEGAEPGASSAGPPAPDTLSLLDGKFSFPLAALPRIGPPDAEHLVVAITDPTCRHCRRAEEQLASALALYPEGSLAVVFLPAARDTLLGPALQQILLTLWREKPEAWALLHADLAAGRQEVTLEAVHARAAEALGGAEALDRTLRTHQAANGELIRLATELAAANAEANEHDFVVPQILAGTATAFGSPDPERLHTLLQRQYALAAPDPEALAAALRSDAGKDPCDPRTRQFCGRLIISMIGAGEEPEAMFTAHKKVADDIFEYNALSHLKQFSPTGGALPVKALAFSSDAGFNAQAPNLFKAENGKFMGAHAMSADTFPQVLGANAQKSHLQQAIAEFEQNKECKALKEKHKLESIVPLLKVEVIMDGHYDEKNGGQPGLAAWKHSHDTGTAAKWEQPGTDVGFFQKEQWKMLADTLQGAVIQTFNTACRSSKMAADFERFIDQQMPNTQCSCFVAAAAKEQKEYGVSAVNPFLNSAMKDEGAALRANFAKANDWEGAANAVSMLPHLYNKHKVAVLTPVDHPLGPPLRSLSASEAADVPGTKVHYKRNPLMGFVWSSADILAEEALEEIKGEPAISILNAQYMHEIPPGLLEKVSPAAGLRDDYIRIMGHIEKTERQYQPLFSESKKRLDSTVFDREYGNFSDCNNATGVMRDTCLKMHIAIKEIEANPVTETDGKFKIAKIALISALQTHNVREIWKGYVGGTKKVGDVFTGLDEIWDAYRAFKINLSALSFGSSGEDRQVHADIQKGLDFMTDSFEKAYASIQNQVFEELRNEAIKVKLARMRQAANLLAQNGSRDSTHKLKDMASKLNCLTQYAVGPAFDQQQPGPAPILDPLPLVELPSVLDGKKQ